jgi:hypothetical protein
MEIVFVYPRLRRDFGRAPKFQDIAPDILSESLPNPEMLGEYVERNPTDVGIQCIPEYSEHEVRHKSLHFFFPRPAVLLAERSCRLSWRHDTRDLKAV